MKLPADPLKWIAMSAAIAATSTAEYDLARDIGMASVLAASVPVALDAYVVRALVKHREVLTSVLAMVGVNAASHLQARGIIPMGWELITAVSAIPPLVLWRVHALQSPGTWRARKLWGIKKGEHVEHAPEHDLVAVPEPSTVTCSNCGHAHHGEHGHTTSTDGPGGMRACLAHGCSCFEEIRELCGYCYEHAHEARTACVWGHTECEHEAQCVVYADPAVPETSTHDEHDELDVPDFMREPMSTLRSTLAAVPVPDWDPVLAAGTGTDVDTHGEHAPSTVSTLTLVPDLPSEYEASTPSTAGEHAVLNAEHMRAGRITMADTAFMEQARVLASRTVGVPGINEIKRQLSTGTDRARRLRTALEHEASEETS